jgi:hypothetical protein
VGQERKETLGRLNSWKILHLCNKMIAHLVRHQRE